MVGRRGGELLFCVVDLDQVSPAARWCSWRHCQRSWRNRTAPPALTEVIFGVMPLQVDSSVGGSSRPGGCRDHSVGPISGT